MKTLFTLFTIVALMCSCQSSEKKSKADGGSSEAEAIQSDVLPSAAMLDRTDTLQLGGKQTVVHIERKQDDAQPVVTTEMGTKFADNKVDISLEQGGDIVWQRTFTKTDFDSYLTPVERQSCVLLGMAVEPESSTASILQFVAQIGTPGLEVGPAFIVKMAATSDKIVSITADKRQDSVIEKVDADNIAE